MKSAYDFNDQRLPQEILDDDAKSSSEDQIATPAIDPDATSVPSGFREEDFSPWLTPRTDRTISGQRESAPIRLKRSGDVREMVDLIKKRAKSTRAY
jgi:hypothetical protein